MDQDQRARFQQAVERKKADAEARSHQGARHGSHGPVEGGQEASLHGDQRPQAAVDPRAKNSVHGQVTADKWNQ